MTYDTDTMTREAAIEYLKRVCIIRRNGHLSNTEEAARNILMDTADALTTNAAIVLKPEVGMGVTYIGWTDRHPFEVVRVCTQKKIVIRAMKATIHPDWKPDFVPGGFSAHCANNSSQEWILESDPAGLERTVRLHKDGYWREAGSTCRYRVGQAVKHHDYNF